MLTRMAPAQQILTLPAQAIFPGLLESAYRRELQNFSVHNAIARLWAKDSSLWPPEEYQAGCVKVNGRGLDLRDQLELLLTRVAARAAMIEQAGFEDVVFVGMGDSRLAAKAVLRLSAARLGKRSFWLDSIDPDAVRRMDEMLHFDRTLFIFANKSGNQIETHSLLLYFLGRLKMLGIHSPERHFVILSEENSYLGELTGEYNFLDSFLDPPGIHGRYSSLLHFNFFLVWLSRLDPHVLLERAQVMRDACGPSAPRETNPALALGALLAAAEVEGLDRFVIFSTDSLKPVARRIGYLAPPSTGKKGRGIVPVFDGPSSRIAMLHRGCFVVLLKMTGEDEPELGKRCDELRAAGVPVVTIELHGSEELAVELFKCEMTTALH